jgi:hypothetical protein
MEHWFDRLAQPHTRRTALKAGAVAGAMLVLPNSRLPQAIASSNERCFPPCVAAAAKAFNAANASCFNNQRLGAVGALLTVSPGTSFLTSLVGWNCYSGAELSWHRAVDACKGSQCGDPGKYPGGQLPKPPPPKCTPGSDVVCGDRCCSVAAECCACSADPSGYCCCAAGKCGSSGCV